MIVAHLWKITTGAGVVVSLALGVTLFFANREISGLKADRETLTTELAICTTNTSTLRASIDERNEAIQRQAEELSRVAEIARKQVEIAQAERRRADHRVAEALARPITGSTLEARVLDVDARIKESLK